MVLLGVDGGSVLLRSTGNAKWIHLCSRLDVRVLVLAESATVLGQGKRAEGCVLRVLSTIRNLVLLGGLVCGGDEQ